MRDTKATETSMGQGFNNFIGIMIAHQQELRTVRLCETVKLLAII